MTEGHSSILYVFCAAWANSIQSSGVLDVNVSMQDLAFGNVLTLEFAITNTGSLSGDFVAIALASPPLGGVKMLKVCRWQLHPTRVVLSF